MKNMITKMRRIPKWILLLIPAVALIVVTTSVAAQEDKNVSVRVNAPEFASGRFEVTIDIYDVIDLTSGQFDLSFNPDVVNVNEVRDGEIDGTTIPIETWRLVEDGRARILFGLPDAGLVSGSGYIATINFEVVGNDGDTSALDVSKGELFSYTSDDDPLLEGNTEHKEIDADWSGDVVTVGNTGMVETEKRTETPAHTATPRPSASSLDSGRGLVAASVHPTEYVSDAAVPVGTPERDEPDPWKMIAATNFIGIYSFIGLLAFIYTLTLFR